MPTYVVCLWATANTVLYILRDVWMLSTLRRLNGVENYEDRSYFVLTLCLSMLGTILFGSYASISSYYQLNQLSQNRQPGQRTCESITWQFCISGTQRSKRLAWAGFGIIAIIAIVVESFLFVSFWLWFIQFRRSIGGTDEIICAFFGVIGAFNILLGGMGVYWLLVSGHVGEILVGCADHQ